MMHNHIYRECSLDLTRALRLTLVTIGQIHGKSEAPVK
jgi:hypothetical protein